MAHASKSRRKESALCLMLGCRSTARLGTRRPASARPGFPRDRRQLAGCDHLASTSGPLRPDTEYPPGRKAGLVESLINYPPKDIDVLLMEGTTIGRSGTSEGFTTESALEQEFVQAFRKTRGIHFIWASAQNIDRAEHRPHGDDLSGSQANGPDAHH